MTTHEKRITAGTLEARSDAATGGKLTGYAAVFNQETVIAGMFREVIMPGAFADAVGADDVRAQMNHDSNLILGRTGAGTLRLSEDAHGLRYEIDMPDTSYARDLMVSVQRGDVSQSSFMFDVPSSTDETWDYAATKSGQLPLRQIHRVRLYDVSPVVFPAYDGTSVSARALAMTEAAPAEVAPELVVVDEIPPPDQSAAALAVLLELDELELS